MVNVMNVEHNFHRDDELSRTMNQVLGKSLAHETINYLSMVYPLDLDNQEKRDAFATLIKEPPMENDAISAQYPLETQQFGIISAAVKVARIKWSEDREKFERLGDQFDAYHDPKTQDPNVSYNDFGRLTKAVLPALKKMSDEYTLKLFDENTSFEEIEAITNGPLSKANCFVYNEYPEKVEDNPEQAKGVLARIARSLGDHPKEQLDICYEEVIARSKAQGVKEVNYGRNGMSELERAGTPEQRQAGFEKWEEKQEQQSLSNSQTLNRTGEGR